ncbi:MAG TPA: hypothetical protein VLC09_06515 [Polyangiaceae bacterium]|nr:hypothetical protein [Polyangiaceae bacterium]
MAKVLPPLQPSFFAELPDRPEVRELCALFEAGRYAELRARVAAIDPSDEPLRTIGQRLIERTRPEPWLLWLLALTALLLLLVTIFAYRGA